jgi:hypothetical protein
MNRRLRFRIGQPLDDPKPNLRLARRVNLTKIQGVIVGQLEYLSGLYAQDLCEVASLLTRDFGLAVTHLVYEKPAPRHPPSF